MIRTNLTESQNQTVIVLTHTNICLLNEIQRLKKEC